MENGAYDLEGVIWHQHSNKLMKKILELWPVNTLNTKPIVDIGCGMNFYVTVYAHAGGYGLGYDAIELGRLTVKQDVTQTIKKDSDGKWNVLSLEVGEHIPADKADAYLDNVTRFEGDVILSWALPGQAGHGHINCKSNAWVIDEMRKRDYEIDFGVTHDLRQAVVGCHCTWFIHTLMYFRPRVQE